MIMRLFIYVSLLSVALNAGAAVFPYVNITGSGGLTNASLTASRLAVTDANKKVTSVSTTGLVDGTGSAVTVGSGLSFSGGTLSASGNGNVTNTGASGTIFASQIAPAVPQVHLTWNAGTIAASSANTKFGIFRGVKKGEPLSVSAPQDLGTGLTASVQSTALDTFTITVFNPTTNSIAAGTGVEWVVSRSVPQPIPVATSGSYLSPTNLVAVYDMVTITNSGATLVDISGHGNDGTITSGTTNTAGLIFNGSSTRVDIPALVGGTNFTILILASSTTPSAFAWSENGDPQSDNNSLGMSVGSGGGTSFTRIYNTSIKADWGNFGAPAYGAGWHLYCLQRNFGSGTYGVLDQGFLQTKLLGNITNIITTIGTIGARRSTASTASLYWTGTNAYMAIWSGTNGCLNKSDLAAAYKYIQSSVTNRGVYLPDAVHKLYPGGVWQRQGTVIAGNSIATEVYDEKVLYTTTDCQIVSNPGFMMLLDYGTAGIFYTESKNGLDWAPLTGPVLQNVCQPGWVYETNSGKYYVSASHPVGGSGTNVSIFVSPAHTPNSYSLLQTNAILATSLGQSIVNNTGMTEVAGTLYMLIESPNGMYGATSVAPYTNWVVSTHTFDSNPTGDRILGPSPYLIDGTWYTWGHQNLGIYRRQASTWDSVWTRSCPSCEIVNGTSLYTFGTGAGDETNQLATPSLVEDGQGHTFMFYCASDAGNVLSIKCAIANMTMAELVKTGEGATSDAP